MTAGNLSHAISLAVGGFGTSTITYGFYGSTSDLPSSYTGRLVEHPATPPATTPHYTDVFSALTTPEQAFITSLFNGALTNELGVSFSVASTPASAQIGMGGLNYAATTGIGTVGGWAFYPNDTTGAEGDFWILTDARIATGNEYAFSFGTAGDNYYVSSAHELGHALGLRHTAEVFSGSFDDDQKYSIMSYNVGAQQNPAYTYQLYDVAALQYEYGANTSFNSGNTTYDNFTATYPTGSGTYDLQATLWDTSGTDTIDASAYSKASFIDLRPGHFSTVGDHANAVVSGGAINYTGFENISIAFGVTIENAIGTDKNDGILGNAYSNHLVGGSGNDVIYGDGDLAPGSLGDTADYSTISKGAVNAVTVDHSVQADTLEGGAGTDFLQGGAGADSLDGGDENDTLIGGQGNDVLQGGNGDDTIVIDGNDVSADGGAGHDTLSLANATAGVSLTIGTTSLTAGSTSVDHFEAYVGSDYADTLTATGSSPSTIDGGAGADTITGADGDDSLSGGAGADTIYGGQGADTINGGDGADHLTASGVGSNIDGGVGADTIESSALGITIRGGPGADHIDVTSSITIEDGYPAGRDSGDYITYAFAAGDGLDDIASQSFGDFSYSGVDRLLFLGMSQSDVSIHMTVDQEDTDPLPDFPGVGPAHYHWGEVYLVINSTSEQFDLGHGSVVTYDGAPEWNSWGVDYMPFAEIAFENGGVQTYTASDFVFG